MRLSIRVRGASMSRTSGRWSRRMRSFEALPFGRARTTRPLRSARNSLRRFVFSASTMLTYSEEVSDLVLGTLWSQWAELGLSGWERHHKDVALDLEALI